MRASCGTAEAVEHLGGVAHGGPVGLAAHDDADERVHRAASGDIVRDQAAFQPGDLVLQHQLALLQPLKVKLVDAP